MALESYKSKRDFKTTPEPAGEVASSESGHSFVIQKHAARRLHYDFRLEMDGVLKSWAVTRGPSLVPGEKRLAVHVEDHPLDYGDFEGTIPKGEYGGGTVLLWDRGTWEPVYDPARGYAKGHMEFVLHGEKLHGRWHLVRMHGRPREKTENWLLIKGEDDEARGEGDPDILEEHPESVKTGRRIEEIAGESPGWSSKTGRIDREADDAATGKAGNPKGEGAAAKASGKGKAKASKAKAPAAKAPAKLPAKSTTKSSAKSAKSASATSSPAPSEAQPDVEAQGLPAPAGAAAPARKRASAKAGEGTAGPLPRFVEPQLATLVPAAPAGKGWIHEIKYDGYRILARVEGGKVHLLTRTGLDWTARFGKQVTAALAALPVGTALIDGELVVENDAGASDFSALQADLSAERTDRFHYIAFDLLYADGHDLRALPLLARKERLAALLDGADPALRYSEHFGESGAMILRHACRLSLEGVVSKQARGPYESGRGKAWVKSKCSERQEFVVAGYVPSTVSRQAIGSLVLGIYQDGRLVHVGRVGTGFTAAVAEDLMTRLDRLREPRSPFADKLPADASRGVRFVRPELVAEIEFRGWTADRSLRHAAFRGLREDKPARDVVQEGEAAEREKPVRTGVTLTHPDRVYWPEAGVTKQGLADYYAEVWPRMGPYVVGRPLSLVRCPGGIAEACFFQKHAWKGASKVIRQVPDPADAAAEPMLVIDDLPGLIGLVQGGVLEVHPWGSSLADIEHPDQIILDLDPGEGVTWAQVIDAAQEVRQRLQDAGLAAFVKTSGGKGLHVVAPLRPQADWVVTKAFTKQLADAMSADSPDKFLAVISKAKRKGRILVDYLRNGRGATAVAAYSTRSRPGAPVSMPLAWEELGEAIGPSYFTVANTPARLASGAPDPWADFRRAAAPIPAPAGGSAKKSRSAKGR